MVLSNSEYLQWLSTYLLTPPCYANVERVITADFGVSPPSPLVICLNKRNIFLVQDEIEDHGGASSKCGFGSSVEIINGLNKM